MHTLFDRPVCRSNSNKCKQCSYSFEEVQKQKKAETAIVWPEELRRARNESSRKAAQVRRMNREHLKATGERPRPKKKKRTMT